MKGLGTVLNRCQKRGGGAYKRTKDVLTRLAQRRYIPKLFSKEAEISFLTDALSALDDTLRDSQKTIVRRYGESKSLQDSVKKLSSEILDRLKIRAAETPDVDAAEDVNAEVTKIYETV
jgi:hypothetical protein